MFAYIALTALGGLLSIWAWAVYTISQLNYVEINTELDFSVEDFVSDMYKGHRYGLDD